MSALTIFVLAMLGSMAVLAQAQHNVAPVVINGSGTNSCPSFQQRKSARLNLLNQVHSVLRQTPMHLTVDQCGDGMWYKLVSVNMSNPLNQCPGDWVEENEGGVRACGRGTIGASCKSLILNSEHHTYSKVCGRAIGYQYGHTDAFLAGTDMSINGTYVDGLSITYSSPRRHLWTYASGLREIGPTSYRSSNCPCSSLPGRSAPSFVGNNWYCESGNPNTDYPVILFPNDPLWDGEDCEGTCCSNDKSPPWFSVDLSTPTSDNIEARICSSEHSDTHEDVFIEILEIYIQ